MSLLIEGKMSDNPFEGLNDPVKERVRRESDRRKQRWVAFWASLAAVASVAACTGFGGAIGERLGGGGSRSAINPLIRGNVGGLVRGKRAFLYFPWAGMK